MKISILCVGTRGDVQPNLALAIALKKRGHEVILGAPDNFKEWVEKHGVAFYPMGIDMEAFLQSPEAKQLIAGNWFALPKMWRKMIVPMINGTLNAIWEAAKDADVILYHPKAHGALDVAEATGARAIYSTPVPIFTTSAFPLLTMSWSLGRWFNRFTYKLMMLSRIIFHGTIGRWRQETLGLDKGPWFVPLEGYGPVLCSVSPSVVKLLPEDYERIHMTGYWFLDEGQEWTPDSDLQAFLDAGEAPVYIGFGSMTTLEPAQVTAEVIDGIQRAGVRAILATGWGAMDKQEVPENIYIIESAPHQELFKHVCAVVHHGGAGSTAAGLRAGKPTLICPMAVDQPFWGRRVYDLGCGPRHLHLKKLKAKVFGDRLEELVGTESYRIQAEEIAGKIAFEDGIGEAIRVIEAEPITQESA